MLPLMAIQTPSIPTALSSQAALCPICHGPLQELRGLSRCSRCQFVICQACDGEQIGNLEDEGAEY